MLVWMGISHLAIGNKQNNITALKVLKAAYDSDPVNPKMLKYLASAYALNGDMGQASLMTAEYFVLLGAFNAAIMHAKRAEKILKPNSVGLQRAKDILNISSKLE
jgi:predicted Zn-dependent protease